MRVRLLLGPAGSGKTFRCLTEARAALLASPEGPALVLLAPKQTTYQLERQLLATPSLAGYTRLHILSFDRLAHFVLDQLGQPAPAMLNEEGRVMVLRGLLSRRRTALKLFRASARLTGFAQQLSLVLRELQEHQFTPESLRQLAAEVQGDGLAFKLEDLATLLRDYLDWLQAHRLQDAESLLNEATKAIEGRNSPAEPPTPKVRRTQKSKSDIGQLDLFARLVIAANGQSAHRSYPSSQLTAPDPGKSPPAQRLLGRLWVDGFLEFSPQELGLLAALMPHCEEARLTFCLDRIPAQKRSWLSSWSVAQRAFEACKQRLAEVPGADVTVELLQRDPDRNRFAENPVLAHLENHWAEPEAYQPSAHSDPATAPALDRVLRVATCAQPEAEATLAAREILRHVRTGGRFREVAVLVRRLDSYHRVLQRVFTRYEIPFFLDRRESVSHHPLAELTRNALRTITFGWQHEDWFAALKTGLVCDQSEEIDELENEALARGWTGQIWRAPLQIKDQPRSPAETESLRHLETRLERLRQQVVPPFHRLASAIGTHPNQLTGTVLSSAVRQFWQEFGVEATLQRWTEDQGSVHGTVWEQMNVWLDNLALAFATDALSLRGWLPVLDAGLANLTVGLIPPALDQVTIGAIDRSRNPDLNLALVLGLNESVFPAPPETPVLLTEADRGQLMQRNVKLAAGAREQLARERHYAYLACTRARQRLVLTHSLHDESGSPLNPSPFLAHLRQLFPALQIESAPRIHDWRDSEHPSELLVTLRSRLSEPPPRAQAPAPSLASLASTDDRERLAELPAMAAALEGMRHLRHPNLGARLAPDLAAQLYGPAMRTSVSRMENFAACPFKFFIHSGLRAEERRRFELDAREQGNFQHDVLACFHEELRVEGKLWRQIEPGEARQRIERIAQNRIATFRDGLLAATVESRFTARSLTGALQNFAAIMVGWMHTQYRFDPAAVELPFGETEGDAAPELKLGDGHSLVLRGRIDRIDLFRRNADEAMCVVVDYKSSPKKLDPVLMACGLQLQLPAYLNVLRAWPDPQATFGVGRLVPVGVFYVSLRGRPLPAPNRRQALAEPEEARQRAYRHTGRFDAQVLPQLDARPNQIFGDQFRYQRNQSGELRKGSPEALGTAEFRALLDGVDNQLRKMGRAIFAGEAAVSPFRNGSMEACRTCDYASVCRIDRWTHTFRTPLDERKAAAAEAEEWDEQSAK